MPGKHAPSSPTSFYLSVARAAAGALAVLGIVVVMAILAVGSRNGDVASPTTPTATATTTATSSPTVRATPSTAEPTETAEPRPRDETTVLVLNGAGVQGLAGRVSDELDEDGYDMQAPGNAAATATTKVYYRKGGKLEAEALRKLRFDFVEKVARAPSGLPGDALVVVVLGRDFPS